MKNNIIPTSKIFFYILIRSWNSWKFFDKCIDSVLTQSYKNYEILFVDDASGYSKKQKEYIKNKLKGHKVVFNAKRKYSLLNAYNLIHKYAHNDKAIIFNLDGDDWLANKNTLNEVSKIYQKNKECLLTYGSCLIFDDNKVLNPVRVLPKYRNVEYPEKVIKSKSYRKEEFRPFHPLTWKVSLFKAIKKKEFLRRDKSWISFSQDQAILYPLLEVANGNYKVIKKYLYVYNQSTNYSDSKINLFGQIKDEIIIRRKNIRRKNKNVFNSLKVESNKIYIYYSKLPSIPFLGNLIYSIQTFLLNRNLLNYFLVSLKDKKQKSIFFSAVKNSNSQVYLRSWMFHEYVKNLNNYMVLDFKVGGMNNINLDNLYRIKWCTVYADAATKKTKKDLYKIIPEDYPVV